MRIPTIEEQMSAAMPEQYQNYYAKIKRAAEVLTKEVKFITTLIFNNHKNPINFLIRLSIFSNYLIKVTKLTETHTI
ncbi:hypothetical protein NDK43_13830 [Neobacillus pocheonensis]|uniref:Uncharacterized protein n=1 Tax=Neobacillus pocheonensis TaxID=363869 RepID=A0ABT0WAB9_9BACI|nr:hypothetical protein [Neobacillus pocheonensis]